MSTFSSFISPSRTLRGTNIKSKKKMFEVLSRILSPVGDDQVSDNFIYQKLYARERIGSTGVGRGVVMPHCRVPNLSITRLAIIVLNEPIEYDTPDDLPADIFLGIIFPEDARDIHLKFLSNIAKMLRQDSFREKLRATQDNEQLYDFLLNTDD
ncbi:MAG: PTS system nitrogen regulatory IIA component [Francisellaceae bacterium]